MNKEQTKNRIVWLMDGTISTTKPRDWNIVADLAKQLVDDVGNTEFEHEIVLPQECWPRLAKALAQENPSVVLDLTRWLTPSLRELFPSTPVEHFGISRIHAVSTLKLDKSAFRIGKSTEQIGKIRRGLDFSRPLIIDDVAFSGRTINKVMDLWHIDPETASLGFLVANTGDFGPNKPGPVGEWKSKGTRVCFGKEVQTPNDDGFHFNDLLAIPSPEQAFIVSVLLQELAQESSDDQTVIRLLESETVIRTLFPQAVSTSEVSRLRAEGRLVTLDNFSERKAMLHSANPVAWVIPSFVKRSDPRQLIDNRDRIGATIRRLQDLTSDPQNLVESSNEFRGQTREIIRQVNLERESGGSKER